MPKKQTAFSTKVLTPHTDDDQPVSMEDFCRYLIQPNAYFFIPCRELWPASSVNARLPRIPLLTKSGQPKRDKNGKAIRIPATKWIDDNRRVEQTTWHPGLPMFITDRLAVAGGWVEKRGTISFNLYRAPRIVPGDRSKAKPWLDHIHKIYPDEAEHIIRWLAHHRQHPGDKINHALVLGGPQGIGKDSLLEPVKHAIGPWNFHEIAPGHLLGQFNGYTRSVILRINEGHDLGNIDRFKFYDRTKIYTAAPPDVLRVNEKNLKEYYVLNCCGLVVTTNHLTDGLYLPADDRRHYVAWSKPVWWPALFDALLSAALTRKVYVRLLVSKWAHTSGLIEPLLIALQKAADAGRVDSSMSSGQLEIKQFIIPGWDSTTGSRRKFPGHTRVNHTKYIVTDRRINIGTSNMTWDYFASTAGSSFNDDHPALVRTLQAVFDRDWASSYAWRLTG
jgi:hypothetical protein